MSYESSELARSCPQGPFRNSKMHATKGAAEGRPPLWRRPKAASFALALIKAHVLALNTAHVLCLNKADVLALNKAHVLRLNTKICPASSQMYTKWTLKDTNGH